MRHLTWVPILVPQQVFLLEVRVPRWDIRKGDHLELHRYLMVVWVEDNPPHNRIPPVRLAAASLSRHILSRCHPCLLPRHGEADGFTPPSDAM